MQPALSLFGVAFLVWTGVQVLLGGARAEATFEAGLIIGAGMVLAGRSRG